MFYKTEKISSRQVFALITMEMLGAGFVVMPYLAIALAWRDGLAAILAASIVAVVYAMLIIKGEEFFNGLDFFDCASVALGKIPSNILRLGFAVKSVLFAGFGLRLFGESTSRVMESEISPYFIMAAMMLCVLYCVIKGRETGGRLAEVFVLLYLLALAFVFLWGIPQGHIIELRPVLGEEGSAILKAVYCLMLWFYPLEYALIAMPYVSDRHKLKKSCTLAVCVSGVFAAAIFALTLCRFGAPQMRQMTYPVLEMMYSVNLPTSFIERQEGLMLGLWVVGMFFALRGAIYYGGECAACVFKGTDRGIVCLLCGIGALCIGLLPKNGKGAENCLYNVVLVAESLYFVVLPLLLLCVGLRRGVKK